MEHQRVGIVSPAGPKRAGDGRGDAASERSGRDRRHEHNGGEDERHAGKSVGAELGDPPGLDQSGRSLGQHDQDIGPGQPDQERQHRRFQHQGRTRIDRLGGW